MKNIQKLIIAAVAMLSVTSPLAAHAAETVQASTADSLSNEETVEKLTYASDKSASKENKITEGWNTINGLKYYYDSDMKKSTGWKEIDSKNYYFDSTGILKTGWIASDDKWYYSNTDGSRVNNQWITSNNKRYYLADDGIMAIGLTKINDVTYYFTSNGNLTSGWQLINSNWYYFDPDGIMKIGWITDKNKKYYLTESGTMALGWTTINDKEYYFDKNGAIKTGWIGIGQDIFYLDNTGAKVKNSTIDNNKLDDEGKLVLIDNDTVPDIDKYFEDKNLNIDTSECIYKSKTHGISESVFNGIDISNYDGYVDFNSVKQSGIKAVYMKASESNYFIDQYAAQNSINAKKAGLKVGYYHYLTGTSSPEEQARLFYSCIENKPNDLKPCVDVEVSPSTASEYTMRFINEFKKLSNMDVVIYTYSNFISNFDSSLSQYSLWEANYNNTPFSLPSNGIWTNRAGHQYSSTGTVPGVNAQEVDLDVFNHSIFLQ
ncbi:MAG: GH25 family lysozyme [Clostridium sp.]|nr:GH25 family lysozyme [Clostridium sp.]